MCRLSNSFVKYGNPRNVSPPSRADTSFDKGPYDAWWLKDEMWTFSILPKIGRQLTTENFEKVGDLIDGCLHAPELAEGRERARSDTWANIGHSASLAVDYLMDKREKLLASEKTSEPEAAQQSDTKEVTEA